MITFTLNFMICLVLHRIGLLAIMLITKFKVQISKFYVPHVFKEQCVAWHAFTRIAAAAIMKDVEELLHRNLSSAHIDERAHHGSYHVS